jgi:hypothetical protein
MKKTFLICFFISIVIFQVQAQNTQDLTWDFQLLKGGEREPLPRSQSITVENGQDVYIVVSPSTDCFCYIISQNSEGKLFILYDQPVRGERKVRVNPLQEDKSPGEKTLYVIMSLVKQTKLEDFIKSYKGDLNSQMYANDVQREVSNLRDTASGLVEPPSVLVTTAGTTRGEAEEGERAIATRFSGKNMYVRTVTIRTR